MQEHAVPRLQHGYIPGIPITRATLKHSLNRIPVVRSGAPDLVCGEARRVGYTGKQEMDLALYRLKIRAAHGLPTITLPGFYIIEQGIFQELDAWQQEHASPS